MVFFSQHYFFIRLLEGIGDLVRYFNLVSISGSRSAVDIVWSILR